MKKSVIALLGLAVILGGCSNKVSYGDAQAVETTTIDFGSTDLQTIAGEMVDSMMASVRGFESISLSEVSVNPKATQFRVQFREQ